MLGRSLIFHSAFLVDPCVWQTDRQSDELQLLPRLHYGVAM